MMKPLNQVSSVYSGINGRCCCGCAGKHTYSSQNRQWAEKHRGYPISDDEVNDRVVKMMYNKVARLLDNGQGDVTDEPDFVSAVNGNRLYVVYWMS